MLGEIRSSLGELRSLLLLCLGECEGASDIIVGLLERPLVGELLDREVVGDITMEPTRICRG